MKFLKRFARSHCGAVTAVALAVSIATGGVAQAAGGLIRDAETEALLRRYAVPLFKAAGLRPRAVKVHIIAANSINAFVTNGQRIFIHTGLLSQAETPGQVIGVIAHETGHIAGGHLARARQRIEELQTASIVSMLLGVAAVAGGALAGSGGASAGTGVLLGGQQTVQRSFLAYQRTQEAAADQAAVRYLEASKQSGKGMLTLFEKLADQALVSLRNVDPYVLSHPMPRARISLLQRMVANGKYTNKPDSPALQFRHDLVRAKLRGFLEPAPLVLRYYPPTNDSIPANYARSIAYYRAGELGRALPIIDRLIAAIPKNPYFQELKGQMLFESGRVREAIAPLQKAVKIAPRSGLIRILLAQAMIATEDRRLVDRAIAHLVKARHTETRSAMLHRQLALAYASKGNIPRAQLESAEAAMLAGKYKLAKQHAKRAVKSFKKGTPEWLKANDILKFQEPSKS